MLTDRRRTDDVDPERYTMDVDELAEVLKRDTIKAVIPVHLYGQPAAIDRIVQLCDAAKVPVGSVPAAKSQPVKTLAKP